VVRSLQKLKELNIIDDNLKIVGPKTYFVFMGDVISRSAYGMQIFSVLFRLMQVNPERVIYLRGNHEDKKYWHAFGMKAQMKHFLKEIQEKAFVKEVDELFLYLPLGLYLPIPDEKHEFVRLSHLGSARSKKLKEERYTLFLHEEQKESIDRHQIDKKTTDSTPVHVKAVIRSEKKRNDFQEMDGLRLLPPDQGATAWNLLSSPTKVTQEGLKFFHDAFAIVKVGVDKVNWSLTLYNQDVRQMNGYSTRSYQFFTGAEMGLDQIEAAQPPKSVMPARPESSDSSLDSEQGQSGEPGSQNESSAAGSQQNDDGAADSHSLDDSDSKAPKKKSAKTKKKKRVKKKPKKKEEILEPVDPQEGDKAKALVAGEAQPQHQTVLPPLPLAPTQPVAPVAIPAAAQPIVIQPAGHIPTGPYVTITIIPAPGTKIITTSQAPDAHDKQETVIETKTVK
jgi:hypothetical protein